MRHYLDEDYFSLYHQYLNKLQFGWFEEKKREFDKLKPNEAGLLIFVESGGSPVYRSTGNYIENPETGDVEEIQELDYYEKFENREQISLVKYCSLYTPLSVENYWGTFPNLELAKQIIFQERSYNYREVAEELLMELIEFLPDNSTPSDIKSYVYQLEKDFEAVFKDFVSSQPTDTQYRQVIYDFGVYFVTSLRQRYARELRLKPSDETKEFLNFQLNQNQLVAILFLLKEAGILSMDKTAVTKFAANHFKYYHNKDFHAPSDYTKLNEIWTTHDFNLTKKKVKTSAVKKVMEMLQRLTQ